MTKIIKKVRVPAKTIKESTKTVEKVICDVCLEKLPKGTKYNQCSICLRDVCIRSGVTDCYKYDGYDDYPDLYCKLCYELYIPLRDEMTDRHWKEVEALHRKVKKQSIAQLERQSKSKER